MSRTIVCLLAAGVFMVSGVVAAQEADTTAPAKHLTALAGVSRGVCSVLGGADTSLPLDLVQASTFLVHLLDPREAAVAAGRRAAAQQGVSLERMVVEKGSWDRLPYADNMVDLVIAVDLPKESLDQVSLSEVFRVLRPLGKLVAGVSNGREASLSRTDLEHWIKSAGNVTAALSKDRYGLWAVAQKPARAGVDNWSHWEHGPDNNPVSTDAVIKAPYTLQWLAPPYYIAMPAITTAAGGRTFLAMGHIAHHDREEPWLNTLLARNGYNGSELWRRRLPDGYLVHRSAFIATDDVFYMIDPDGRGCLLLDPESGEEKGRIRVPEARGDWKWIALQGQTLFALVGEKPDPAETTLVRSVYPAWSWGELSKGYYEEPQVPWGFGETVLAYDLGAGKLLWAHHETPPMDARAMALGEGRTFFYAPDARLGCLDAASGAVVWTNDDPELRKLINEPGRGLGSTPGFRTSCYCVYTPKGLFFEAQTQMNLVAVSKDDGKLMWYHKKTTSNPNVIYVDGRILVGVGIEGSTLALDPATGETLEDLGFMKRSCARLTATPDSLFCRGYPEGVTRYDRATKTILFDGSMRPACNDGVLPANGLLYVGPWLCDCNLSLMGTVALCSAGTPVEAQPAGDRLESAAPNPREIAPFPLAAQDWPTYRGNNAHTGASAASVSGSLQPLWTWEPSHGYTPTAPTAAGGLVFLAGDDGVARAFDAAGGTMQWAFETAGPILHPPTIWEGRAYVASGDGWVYAIEAATGRLLWRFQAAPIARRILAYGSLCSTWPVNSGVLVEDGTAYFAAGLIDYAGTYVYALDARTGALKWENDSSGRLKPSLGKGVSAQGDLTIMGGLLWMAGGNVISPARYKLGTGEYAGPLPRDGSPESNRGEEIGVFQDEFLIFGGRLQYSSRENVVNPDLFSIARNPGKTVELAQGQTVPIWDADLLVLAPQREAPPQAHASKALADRLKDARAKRQLPAPLWETRALKNSQVIALALARDAVIAACRAPRHRDLRPRWRLCLVDRDSGLLRRDYELPSAIRQNGLAIDRDGRVLLAMADGSLCCYGGNDVFRSYLLSLVGTAKTDAARENAVRRALIAFETVRDPAGQEFLITSLRQLGVDALDPARKAGAVHTWRILGPVPWDNEKNPMDKTFVKEPRVKVNQARKVEGKELTWEKDTTIHPMGMVDLTAYFGDHAGVAAYAYAEVKLAEAQDVLLKIGSNDGFKCWFNEKEVGHFDGGRNYRPDQDTITVHARAGVNRILLKISQEGGGWAFGVRLTDPAGNPCDAACVTP
jgi:outer membrane protein assembly factor BamB